jgi:hypothetical protein
MSQHDYVIDNQSAPAARADINSVLQAIVTQNSGGTSPVVTFANQIWYDTATNEIKKRNEANSAWIVLGTVDDTGGTFTPNSLLTTAGIAPATLVTSSEGIASNNNNTTIPTSAAVKAYVDTSLAGASTGAVGTYAFLQQASVTTTVISEGSTYAGSGLRYSGDGVKDLSGNPGGAPVGTWRAMGADNSTANVKRATVFLRIS